MKRLTLSLIWLLTMVCVNTFAQDFQQHFADSTLRLDYVFAGDCNRQDISLDELSCSPQWYGRRHNLASLPLKGNGSITVCDVAHGDTLYRHSFSTLFQEWLTTAEAKRVKRSF